MHTRDDCSSMKSLKVMGQKQKNKEKQATIMDKEKDICDTISSKTFKSNGSQEGISVNSNFKVKDYISEESSVEYDDDDNDDDILLEEEEEEENKNISQIEEKKKRLDSELYALTALLAPYLDRFGRLSIDMAPHVAMMGHQVHPRNIHNLSNVSLVTQEGSFFSNPNNNSRPTVDNQYPEEFMRFFNPQSINRNRFRNAVYQNNEEEEYQTRFNLHAQNQYLNFEIPVMLTPGEILSIPPRAPANIQLNPVHLHIQAQLPLRGTPNLTADREPLPGPSVSQRADKGVQTEVTPVHNPFSHVATISERNGSDFDLGSFRGSLFDASERTRLHALQRTRRLNTIRTTSNMANADNLSQNPRDITFRRSDFSDESINNSPDTHAARSGSRTREAISKPNISVHGPNDQALLPSADHSAEDLSTHPQLDSPVSYSRLKAKTVSFQIAEMDDNREYTEIGEALETEAGEVLTKVSQASNTAAKTGRLGQR
jgi:hypothetical protein